MGKKRDWAIDAARSAYDTIQGGVSRDVGVNFLASILRTAHQRGAIEATKAKAGEKTS